MMQKNKFGIAMIAVFLGLAFAVLAEDKVVQKKAPVLSADRAALEAQKKALETQKQEVEEKLWNVIHPMSKARENLLKTDSELMVMSREIAAKQAALEKRLLEKYPDLAAQVKERDALTQGLSDLVVKLNAVREKLNDLDSAVRMSEARKKLNELEAADKAEKAKPKDDGP
jgi:short-subunit dehydrogenase involved in D-alanine esterification of teichoic acids